ncbi:MAG: hypothetical protein QOC78_3470 [Solirubrobacteraceae bacterium]|jgi:hypothetical protein|nr:hypothetical protein [Solirubrobacteraceae bacterium]
MALKDPASFLRFLTMGAAGTQAVAQHLKGLGHDMVELERGSTSNKLWTKKIKRLRIADLVCRDCGLRVECRAKTGLAIQASETRGGQAERAWDAGMRDDDLFAFLVVDVGEDGRARAFEPHYFTAAALRESYKDGMEGERKSFKDGYEMTWIWPSKAVAAGGRVAKIDHSGQRIKIERPRAAWSQFPRGNDGAVLASKDLHFYVGERDTVPDHSLLCGVVARPTEDALACPGRWDEPEDEYGAYPRYIAIRLVGLNRDADAVEWLSELAADEREDDRLRLEAVGALASIDPGRVDVVIEWLRGDRVEWAMEAAFILTDLGGAEAEQALIETTLDTTAPSELRSAAAWGLGALDRGDRLVDLLGDGDRAVALHALVALGEPDDELIDTLADVVRDADEDAAPAAALALSRAVSGIERLAEIASGEGDAADVALCALGQLGAGSVPSSSLSASARRIVEVLWRGEGTWLRREQHRAALSLLQRQFLAVTLGGASPDDADAEYEAVEEAHAAEAQLRLEAAAD